MFNVLDWLSQDIIFWFSNISKPYDTLFYLPKNCAGSKPAYSWSISLLATFLRWLTSHRPGSFRWDECGKILQTNLGLICEVSYAKGGIFTFKTWESRVRDPVGGNLPPEYCHNRVLRFGTCLLLKRHQEFCPWKS